MTTVVSSITLAYKSSIVETGPKCNDPHAAIPRVIDMTNTFKRVKWRKRSMEGGNPIGVIEELRLEANVNLPGEKPCAWGKKNNPDGAVASGAIQSSIGDHEISSSQSYRLQWQLSTCCSICHRSLPYVPDDQNAYKGTVDGCRDGDLTDSPAEGGKISMEHQDSWTKKHQPRSMKKALYGLKQTCRVWNFKQAVQVRHLRLLLDWRLEGTNIRIEPVYVDDLRIFRSASAGTRFWRSKWRSSWWGIWEIQRSRNPCNHRGQRSIFGPGGSTNF